MRHEKLPPPRSVTPADMWREATAGKCAQAAIDWLKSSVNLDRKIRSLKREEFERLAVHITSTWIVLASERTQDPDAPEEISLLL